MNPTPVPDFLTLGDPDPRAPTPRALEAQRGSESQSPGTPESVKLSPPTGANVITPQESPNFPGPQNGGLDFLQLNPILENANIPAVTKPLPGGLIAAPRIDDDEAVQQFAPDVQAFLRVLSKTSSPTKAARIAGVHRTGMYRLRDKNRDFARLWKRAMKYRAELLEDEAIRRAVEGVEEPVFYMGAICGYKRNYSDSLLSKLLEGNMPEKYRQNHKVEVEGNLGVATLVLPAATTAEEWAAQNSGTIIDVEPESDYD